MRGKGKFRDCFWSQVFSSLLGSCEMHQGWKQGTREQVRHKVFNYSLLNLHGRLLAKLLGGPAPHRALFSMCLSYHTEYHCLYNHVLGVSPKADLDFWINYHFSGHKPRSHFSVSRSIKPIPCLSAFSVSQHWSCYSFASLNCHLFTFCQVNQSLNQTEISPADLKVHNFDFTSKFMGTTYPFF